MQLNGASVLAVFVFALVAGFGFALGSWLAGRLVSRT